jgi:hypothetical protein
MSIFTYHPVYPVILQPDGLQVLILRVVPSLRV